LKKAADSAPDGFTLGEVMIADERCVVWLEDPDEATIKQQGMDVVISQKESPPEADEIPGESLPVITEAREKILDYLYGVTCDNPERIIGIEFVELFRELKPENGLIVPSSDATDITNLDIMELSKDLEYLRRRGFVECIWCNVEESEKGVGIITQMVVTLTLEGFEFYERLVMAKKNRMDIKTMDPGMDASGERK